MLLVLANYRTGSTTLCHELTREYQLEEPKSGVDFEVFMRGYKSDPAPYRNRVVKVIPNQINEDCWEKFKTVWVPEADEIVYCGRRDWYAQIISFCIAKQSNQWHPHTVNPYLSYNDKPKTFSVNIGTVHTWEKKMRVNYERMAQLYHEVGGRLVWLEDRIQTPYTPSGTIRADVKASPSDLIEPDLNIENLFKK